MAFNESIGYYEKPRRLKTHDYGSNSWYMITMNTFRRVKYFSDVVMSDHGPTLQPTEVYNIATECWKQIPVHYPYVILDEIAILPEHIHMILKIEKYTSTDKQNLGYVISGFKSSVKRIANKQGLSIEWQRSYHDKIIFNRETLIHCRNYIKNNVTEYLKKRL